MHDDDLPITEPLLRDWLAARTPQWADLPLRRLRSSGTDNALFGIGDHLLLRMPRRAASIPMLSKELDWLPHLAGLPLPVPCLRHRGRITLGMDCDIGIFDWMPGEIALPETIADPFAAARSLAGFLQALHTVSTEGAPLAGPTNNHRGVALVQMQDLTLRSIDMVADEIDADAARVLWQSAASEPSEKPPRWLHGDLKADNLLCFDGRLSGVIDWGLAAVGDPAADYAAAWSWVDPAARDSFRRVLALDDGDWLRGKGWALYGAVIALSYYRGGRNEALCRQSRLTLDRLGLLTATAR